jgi:hypothetical protein
MDVLPMAIDGVVHDLGVGRTRRDPNGQNDDTTEHDVGKQTECRTYRCYEQAEDGNTQRRAGSRAQDSEHVSDCVQGEEGEIKGGGHLNRVPFTEDWVPGQQSCGGPSERSRD